MFNVTRSGLLLLCSALHISAADNADPSYSGTDQFGRYTVSCTEQSFEGKSYQYGVMVDREKIKDAGYVKHSIKGVRAQCVLLDVVYPRKAGDETYYPALWRRIGDCDVDLYCLNQHTGARLEIGHPDIENGLKAGTHQLKATTVRKDGSYH